MGEKKKALPIEVIDLAEAHSEPSAGTEDLNVTQSVSGLSEMIGNPVRLASYHDLFQRLLDPTLLVDVNTLDILTMNPAAERFSGIPTEESWGKGLVEFAVPEDRDVFTKNLRRSRRRYYPLRFETRWQKVDGEAAIMEILACTLKLPDDSEVLQVLARDITYQRELERKLEELSTTDELTQISNIRNFRNMARVEHERAQRYGQSYAIVLCDVDHFKHFNDTNGHPAGDVVLKGVAAQVKSSCRGTDLPARYGGEEFIVLCAGTTPQQALNLAERIRKRVADHNFEHGEKQPLGHISVSVGIAGYPQNSATLEGAIEAADKALYESKHRGRNCVTLSEAHPPESV